MEKHTQMEALARRSIYLNNFKEPVDSAQLTQEMGQFGEVERVLPGKSGTFAVVEFKEVDAAQNLLQSIQRLRIGKSIVRVQPRRVDFAGADKSQLLHPDEHQSQIDAQKVLECIQEAAAGQDGGFSAQLDALIAQFAISNETANERTQFAQHIQQYLQKYFASPIHIRVFGSSSTGLGFANADLDLNMVFDDDLKETDSGSSVGSPAVSLDEDGGSASSMDHDAQLTPEALANAPMSRAAFIGLAKNARIRLLNRLLNAFRKEQALITAHVPVPDARTPVVRFMLRHPKGLPCEISVQNLLGECKANLVRDLVRAETTGKLWRLLFLLKLWASANGLFSSDDPTSSRKKEQQRQKAGKKQHHKNEEGQEGGGGEGSSQKSAEEGKEAEVDGAEQMEEQTHKNAHPKAHWNSYTLSLCTIAFLQSRGRLPPIGQLIRPNSRTLGGWPIEYDLPFFPLDESIPTLLKGLFTFLYQQLKEDRVLVLWEGRILKVKEFKGKYVQADGRVGKFWRFSTVNVQDPLQLCHNVAGNVSRESLAKMRWKVMFAISALKRSHGEDLRPLFQLESVRKLHEERWEEKGKNKQGTEAGKGTADGGEERMEVDEEATTTE